MNYHQLSCILMENSLDFAMKKGDNNRGKVELRMLEGDNLPHCHIRVNDLGGKICVSLRNPPRYYKHKEFRNEFKNKKCKEDFNTWLDMLCLSSEARLLGLTNWEFLKYRWNLAHKFTKKHSLIPETMQHPDYTTL